MTWRMRWLAGYAGVATLLLGRHVYLSTGCLHGDHGYCRRMTGACGDKRPSECKFGGCACICRCHR